MTDATIGYGSLFEVSDSAASPNSPLEWVSVGEVASIKPPSSTTDQIDVTHMQSPGGRREFVAGLIDSGECSFEMNYVPGSTGDQLLLAILALAPGLRARVCRITYPNYVSDTFTGVLMTYEPTVPVDDKMTATVTFKVSGEIARGANTPASP